MTRGALSAPLPSNHTLPSNHALAFNLHWHLTLHPERDTLTPKSGITPITFA